ncbi:MAG TPA: exo-alpha-sialidase, partial [Propionibacteriaceae bacterium]
EGLPADFGFPIVVHPHDPQTVYVFPLVADGQRIPPEGRARVWRSADAGNTWSSSRQGLPDAFWAAVMRDAMTTDHADQAGIYFGARDGSVFASLDDGDSWTQIAAHLPDVLSIRAAVV